MTLINVSADVGDLFDLGRSWESTGRRPAGETWVLSDDSGRPLAEAVVDAAGASVHSAPGRTLSPGDLVALALRVDVLMRGKRDA